MTLRSWADRGNRAPTLAPPLPTLDTWNSHHWNTRAMCIHRSVSTARHDALVAAAREWAAADERVRALLLKGSLGRGEGDERSDLDLVIVTRPRSCGLTVVRSPRGSTAGWVALTRWPGRLRIPSSASTTARSRSISSTRRPSRTPIPGCETASWHWSTRTDSPMRYQPGLRTSAVFRT